MNARTQASRRAGELDRVADLNVLRLRGDFHEMGRQHGELLRERIADGPLPYYRQMVLRLLGRSSLGPLAPVAVTLLQQLVGRRVARSIPGFVQDTLRGMAEGAELPFARVMEGATMPDSLVWLASQMMRLKRPGPAIAHRVQLGLGCTSAIAWGGATRDGKLLHARNFDYYGVGVWPRHKTVIFHEPEGAQRYVSVASAGIPLGGITAMNEAGLTLTVHQHMFTDRAALGGTPIGVVGDRVMREARDLDEAQRIFEAHAPIGCWTYLVADGNTREVLCFEENPHRKAPRRIATDAERFGYANIYLDRELGETEVNLYGSYWRHNLGRHEHVNALLDAGAGAGALDPQAMAGILADTGRGACRIREAIAMVMTVGSVVFRPEDGVLWVGTGEAPTSVGRWIPLSLERQGHAPEHGELDTAAAGPERDAFEEYRRAYVAYMDDDDPAAAMEHAAEASRLASDQALYHQLHGLFAFQTGAVDRAGRAFDTALSLGHEDPERVAALHLWRGRTRDAAGDRRGATADYRRALELPADAPVRRAAERNLKRRFTRRHAGKFHVDVALVDVISP